MASATIWWTSTGGGCSCSGRPTFLIGHTNLYGLGTNSHLAGHVGQGMLLFYLRAKADESISLGESRIVENDLGASDGLVALRKKLVEREVVHVGREVANPDGRVWLARLETGGVVVELETHWWVAIGDNLATEPVHGEDGALVAVEVDEAVTGRFAGELVRHHLDGNDAVLPELHHGGAKKILVHVRLQTPDPKCAHAGHLAAVLVTLL